MSQVDYYSANVEILFLRTLTSNLLCQIIGASIKKYENMTIAKSSQTVNQDIEL